MTEQWNMDGKRQAAYALLLNSFRQPKRWSELPTDVPWQQLLGCPPEQALRLFLDLGYLEYPDRDLPARAKLRRLSMAELRDLLKERDLRTRGRKSTLIARLLESDPEGMEKVTQELNPLQCTEAGGSIIDAFLASGGSLDGLAPDPAASAEPVPPALPFAWIADRFSHRAPVDVDPAPQAGADEFLRLVEQAPPSDAAQHLQQGHIYGARGDLIQALLEFDLAIEADPQDPEAHLWRAVTLQRLGDHRQALSDLQKAHDLNGGGPDVLIEYGNIYLALDQWQLAIAQYDLALAIDPQRAQAFHNRGVAYERMGQAADARADFERAIQINPGAFESHLGMAVACDRLDDRAQAITAYRSAIERADQGALADQARARLRALADPN